MKKKNVYGKADIKKITSLMAASSCGEEILQDFMAAVASGDRAAVTDCIREWDATVELEAIPGFLGRVKQHQEEVRMAFGL